MDNVAIVGGGIGGLAAALALLRRGIDVDVYEQAPELRELGAGVQISANGTRVLHALGLKGALGESPGAAGRQGDPAVELPGRAGSCSISAWNRSSAMAFPTSPSIAAICTASSRKPCCRQSPAPFT